MLAHATGPPSLRAGEERGVPLPSCIRFNTLSSVSFLMTDIGSHDCYETITKYMLFI